MKDTGASRTNTHTDSGRSTWDAVFDKGQQQKLGDNSENTQCPPERGSPDQRTQPEWARGPHSPTTTGSDTLGSGSGTGRGGVSCTLP